MTAPDVVVVGAGTMGAWIALHARRAGWTTTLVDAYGAGHPRASSGDETRIIRSAHGVDAFLTRWSREARVAWRTFGEESGERVFVETGVLWFATRQNGFEDASLTTMASLGIPVEKLPPADVATRWPHIATDDLAFAAFEPEAGLLMARRGVAAVARAFGAAGGGFELGHVVPGTVDGGRLVDVVADDGTRLRAGTFVFAAGPWLPGLFPEVAGELINVTKQDVLYFGPPAGDGRFGAEWSPAWVDFDAAMYGIPAVDGRGVKIGSDRYGPPFDPDTGERIVDPDSVRQARSYAARRFPALADAPIVETRVCQYEATADTQFVIDRHPELDNVWLVGGGSGHGFKHGPVIGSYVLGRLVGAPPGPDEERFAIGRPRVPRQNVRTAAG